ncbi:hypothetical protein CI741_14320, partial [Klebsiella pneumoniae subsp. pneumoniae]
HKAASVTFGNDLADITDSEKIKHGLLVNFGKNIARQVSSLCASAMRVYPNEKHKPSSQLFHCINYACANTVLVTLFRLKSAS